MVGYGFGGPLIPKLHGRCSGCFLAHCLVVFVGDCNMPPPQITRLDTARFGAHSAEWQIQLFLTHH